MKKITLLFLLLFSIFLIPSTGISAYFHLTYDEKTTDFVDGVRHTRMVANINYNSVETPQIINYLGANPTSSSDLNIIVGDNYANFDFGKGELNTMINNINTRYPNYEVIGGVNGDFYATNGIPIEAYVHNFEVLSMGLGTQRTVVGFKDNGEVVFGRPEFTGYEAIVYDEDGNIKNIIPLEYINRKPTTPTNVSVYFEDFPSSITGDFNKLIFKATNTKLEWYKRTYFGKGNLLSTTTDEIEIDLQRFVLVGETLNDDNHITETDTVVIQQHMGGDFEGVRYAIGAWEELVKDGVATEVYTEGAGPDVRHPRTAIGVKEDGTVFFVVVDGRDYINGYLGVTEYELSEIMLYFDAVQAYNLDGGGSSAMSLINPDGEYIYLNTPSDGYPRQVSNGLFFVRGEHEDPPVRLPYPDTRELLTAPQQFSINADGLLTFEQISHASSYDIEIDDQVFTTVNPELQLNLLPGVHHIRVKANGNYTTYKDSEYSPIIIYTEYTDQMKKFLDLLKQIAKTEAH